MKRKVGKFCWVCFPWILPSENFFVHYNFSFIPLRQSCDLNYILVFFQLSRSFPPVSLTTSVRLGIHKYFFVCFFVAIVYSMATDIMYFYSGFPSVYNVFSFIIFIVNLLFRFLFRLLQSPATRKKQLFF